jgi:hypothetical protein
MAMMEITTKSSINVNAFFARRIIQTVGFSGLHKRRKPFVPHPPKPAQMWHFMGYAIVCASLSLFAQPVNI